MIPRTDHTFLSPIMCIRLSFLISLFLNYVLSAGQEAGFLLLINTQMGKKKAESPEIPGPWGEVSYSDC